MYDFDLVLSSLLIWCWPQFCLYNSLYSLFPHCQHTHTYLFPPFFFRLPLQSRFLSLAATHLLHLSQGYEDWLRHKADCSINECPVDVVQQGKVVRTQSHKLRVRMASLEQHSTWGHKATLLFCCIAHFFFPCNCRSHQPTPFSSSLQSSRTFFTAAFALSSLSHQLISPKLW